MAVLPQNFPTPTEPVLANYNYTDVANGQGVVVYQLFTTQDAGGVTYCIAESPIGTTAKYGSSASYDFYSSAFNRTIVVRGDCFIKAMQGGNNNGSGSTLSGSITVYRYNSDGTSTQLATKGLVDLTIGNGLNDTYLSEINMLLSIAETTFNKGDKLRVNFTHTGTATGKYLFFDPINRDVTIGSTNISATSTPTYFKVAVPYKIDL